MNVTNILKTLYEKTPKGVKYAFSPIFIRMMVENREFKKTWRALDEYEKMSENRQKELQLKRLKEILIYAQEHVPYYRKLFNQLRFDPYNMNSLSDISVLPVLEKTDAVNLGEALYSDEKRLKYYKTVTGGSSGQALTVLLDKASIYRERACVTHFLSRFGYDPKKTRTVVFLGHNRDKDYYYSPLKNEIVISPFRLFNSEQFENICRDIEKFGATYIMGYPSAIYLFAQMAEKRNRVVRVEHIVYYAENCSPEEKGYIEKVFQCPVDSYYGHTERACFAEIYDNNCKFNGYYGYTELIPTGQDNEYRIVCTGFLSHKMPLIRYATDDVVYINSVDRTMRLVGHKRSEIHLSGKNGQKIFKGALTLHIEELKKIKRYQYVQNEIGKADLCIVEDERLTQQELDTVKKYINRRCEGLLDVNIKIVEEVKLTTRGKFNWAVNNTEKS